MLFFAMILSAFAQDHVFEYEGLKYRIVSKENNTCEVYKGNIDTYVKEIPGYVPTDYFGSCKVIGVGAKAFYWNDYLDHVVLPETIEYIGDSAFGNCRYMKSITIPKSLKTIGDGAFVNDNNMEAVYISDLQSWCNIDFEYESFKPASSSSNPLYVAHNLYLGERRIYDLLIPEGVTDIKGCAFMGGEFTSVIFPSSLKRIGEQAFFHSKLGDDLIINGNITTIGNFAFANCYDLTDIVIRADVTNIGDGAFEYCQNVTSFTLPESLTTIGMSAFFKCVSLTSITLPSGIKSIPSNLFYGCKNLHTVNVAVDLTRISDGAFYDCSSLLYFSIPEQVSIIEPGTFVNCSALVSVNIPAAVTSIGGSAFKGCSSLKSVSLPKALTSIGDEAFMNCTALSSVTIPASVTSIGKNAFVGISPDWWVVECSHLPDINLSSLSTDATLYIHEGVSVPFNSPWAAFNAIKYIETDENIVKTIDDLDYLFDYAAKQACVTSGANSNLSTVAIPEMVTFGGKSYPVTAIAQNAFAGCTSLKGVTIPGTINAINAGVFHGCSDLRILRFADSATPLDCSAAFDTSALDELYVGRDLEWSVFNTIESIGIVEVGNTVTSIPAHALKNCSNLSRFTLGSGVTEIGQSSFPSQSSVTDIVIPSSVKTIGSLAFYGNKFEKVYIGSGLRSVGSYAFSGSSPSEVYITASQAPVAYDAVFSVADNGTLYAQNEDALQSYEAAKDRWDYFADFKTMVVAESILTSQESLRYEPGTTQQLTATVMPEDATLKQIFWRSTNPDIATVSTTGLVTYHRVFDEDGNYVPASEEALDDLRIIATTLYADGPAMAFSTKEVYNGVETVIPEAAEGEIDLSAPLDVYNLSGLRVSGSIDGLARGIYIVRQGSVVEKIAVK